MNDYKDIFEIVSDNYGYYAKFKHNGQLLNPLTPCEWPVYAESIAFNWMQLPENQKQIMSIMMELALMREE